MAVTDFGMLIVLMFFAPPKAKWPIRSTTSGTCTWPLPFIKHCNSVLSALRISMLSTISKCSFAAGTLTSVRLLRWAKAPSPIVSSDTGRFTRCMPVPTKAHSPMLFKPSGRSALQSELVLAKAYAPTSLSVVGR